MVKAYGDVTCGSYQVQVSVVTNKEPTDQTKYLPTIIPSITNNASVKSGNIIMYKQFHVWRKQSKKSHNPLTEIKSSQGSRIVKMEERRLTSQVINSQTIPQGKCDRYPKNEGNIQRYSPDYVHQTLVSPQWITNVPVFDTTV